MGGTADQGTPSAAATGALPPSAAATGALPPSAGSVTVTLVMTDVAGSTRLWAEQPDLMGSVMARHHEIVHGAVTAAGGWRPVDQGEGDAVFAAFDSATAAVAAVVQFQQQLAAEPWPPGIDIKVRVGVHTGEVTTRDGNLFGSTVNRCARLRGLGDGGQVLLSAATFEVVRDRLPDGVTVTDLGDHRMKDLARPEHVHQLLIPGLRQEFPPLASLDRARHNLPIQTSSFLGRDREVTELVDLVTRERLVTITGFGGMGKTRLALQVAAELATGDGDGVWFVDLSAVTEATAVPTMIATTLGVSGGADGPLAAFLDSLRDENLLLVLDNLEQLLPEIAVLVDRLARAGPGVRILATCREPLRVAGEHEYPLRPLELPMPVRRGAVLSEAELGQLSTFAAVSLFLARAVAVRPDFTLTQSNAAAVAAICARLDGLPLALELAAARTRSLSPETLLPRLDNALKILTGGNRSLPTRHQTLRATIAWSYDALQPQEGQLLDRLSVFPGSFTLEAAEAICGPSLTPAGDDLDVLDGIRVLVDRSLLRHHDPTDGRSEDRYSLLVSIRDYAAEQLTATGGTTALNARHAEHYTRLTRLPLEWTWDDHIRQRNAVQAELHNVRAAVRHARLLGTPREEQSLARALMNALTNLGQQQDARTVADDALARPGPATVDRVRLLTTRGMLESNAAHPTLARSWFELAMTGARELGDTALLIDAISGAGMVARSAAEALELMAEGHVLLESLPSTGASLPRWYAAFLLDDLAAKSPFTDPDAAVAGQRRLLAASPSADLRFEQLNLAIILYNQGRLAEAEVLFAPFENADGPPDADPFTQARGAFLAAAMRISRGHYVAAALDLDLTARHLQTLDLPETVAGVAYYRAVLARVAGEPAAAVRALRTFLTDFGGSDELAMMAGAHYLLAVLSREAGDPAAAANLLEQAWAAALSQGQAVMDLALQCLLERAVQVSVHDPAAAARLIGLVIANRGSVPFAHGVTYDTDAMLDDLRGQLGAPEVDRILADTVGQPLPNSPSWTYIDDNEEQV